jgi:hypothetical protein
MQQGCKHDRSDAKEGREEVAILGMQLLPLSFNLPQTRNLDTTDTVRERFLLVEMPRRLSAGTECDQSTLRKFSFAC